MTIKCQPEAAPTPTIEWTKNGQVIGNDDRHTVLLDGTLHVSQMTRSDQGQYTCKATNINGEGRSTTRVSVFGKYKTKVCGLVRNFIRRATLTE